MVVMLVGKMVFSTVIDAAGWAGQIVPLDAVRAISVLIVLVGNVLFSVQSWRQLLKKGPSEGAPSEESEGSNSDTGDEKRGAGSEETD